MADAKEFNILDERWQRRFAPKFKHIAFIFKRLVGVLKEEQEIQAKVNRCFPSWDPVPWHAPPRLIPACKNLLLLRQFFCSKTLINFA